jgi:hypothetical protein
VIRRLLTAADILLTLLHVELLLHRARRAEPARLRARVEELERRVAEMTARRHAGLTPEKLDGLRFARGAVAFYGASSSCSATSAELGAARAAIDDVLADTPKPPVCSTCGDTHRMTIRDRKVPCTRCPVPCQDCRAGGTGAYCWSTPCGCGCHRVAEGAP